MRLKISDWKIGWKSGECRVVTAFQIFDLRSSIFNLNRPSLYPAAADDHVAVVEDDSLARRDRDLGLVEHHLRS